MIDGFLIAAFLTASYFVLMSKLQKKTEHVSFKPVVSLQLRVARSSCAMVGVAGAALQWSMFMRQNAWLVEIAWPGRYWDFWFASFTRFQIIHKTLVVDPADVRTSCFKTQLISSL